MSYRVEHSVAYYKPLIAAATTKEELNKISYAAFMEDSAPICKSVLSNRVDALCMLREVELGFLPNSPRYVAALKKQAATGKNPMFA